MAAGTRAILAGGDSRGGGEGLTSEGYPYHWAIRRWIDGETASLSTVADLDEFARSIAEFIVALQNVDATGGPVAGAHSFYRGTPPEYYHDETSRHSPY